VPHACLIFVLLNFNYTRSIKVGTLSQTPDQILANLKLALPAIAKNIQGGWDNIQAFHIKTNSSISLPIWSCSLDEKVGGRWDGLTAVTDEEGDSSEGDGDDMDMTMENDVAETRSETTQSKGRKRAQDEDEPEKPKKKAKGVQDKIEAAPAAAISQSSAQTSVAASASPSSPAKRASAPTDALPKYRKRKNSSSILIPTPTDLPIVQPSVDVADTPPSTKRVKKLSKSSTIDADSHTPETIPKPTPGLAPKEKKKKKRDTSLEDTQSSVAESKAVTSPTVQVSTTKQRVAKLTDEASTRKKGKKDGVSISLTAIPSKLEAVSSEPSDDALTRKHEKRKSAATASAAKTHTVNTPLTKDELKQKRGSGVGEKKKNKVKTMGGKSAKNDILGKKLAQ
jgi:ribosome biogenesis protein UTP30